jgi:segregation and condensation protein A
VKKFESGDFLRGALQLFNFISDGCEGGSCLFFLVSLHSKKTAKLSFQIKIPVFEGPFDLLLFFIERDELDISNIPIASITNDFLDYLHHLEELNMEVASEFIVVAATLIRIKAKMLLPRKEVDEHGNEIDPREELAQKLIAYRQYKDILETFSAMESERLRLFERGNAQAELSELAVQAHIESEWESLNLYQLLRAFERAMQRLDQKKSKTIHRIRQFSYSIQSQKEFVSDLVKKNKQVNFDQVFEELEDRIHAIVTFLAILEMLNLQEISLVNGEVVNGFYLIPYAETPESIQI